MKKSLKIITVLSLSLLLCAEAIAKPVELKKKYIKGQIEKVVNWQLTNFKAVDLQNRDIPVTDWAYAPFINGMFAVSKIKGNEAYIDKLIEIGQRDNWELLGSMFPANDHATPQTWLEIYDIKGDPAMIAPTRRELDKFMDDVEAGDNCLTFTPPNFHKWSWCDALYMSPPTFVHMAAITGEQKYLDFTHKWWGELTAVYYDTERHLFYRDHKEILKRESNGEPVFWSRGLGWVVGGIVRVLQYLPEDDPAREMYVSQLQEMCHALIALQQPYGLWAPGLLDPQRWNQAETSGSALIIYAMAYGVNEGLLDKKEYREVIEKGWVALCEYVKEDGKFIGVQPIGDAPADYDGEYSLPYGSGSYLLAASEVYRFL